MTLNSIFRVLEDRQLRGLDLLLFFRTSQSNCTADLVHNTTRAVLVKTTCVLSRLLLSLSLLVKQKI